MFDYSVLWCICFLRGFKKGSSYSPAPTAASTPLFMASFPGGEFADLMNSKEKYCLYLFPPNFFIWKQNPLIIFHLCCQAPYHRAMHQRITNIHRHHPHHRGGGGGGVSITNRNRETLRTNIIEETILSLNHHAQMREEGTSTDSQLMQQELIESGVHLPAGWSRNPHSSHQKTMTHMFWHTKGSFWQGFMTGQKETNHRR